MLHGSTFQRFYNLPNSSTKQGMRAQMCEPMGTIPTQTTIKVMASKWSAWHPSPKAQGTSWKRREKDCKTQRPKAASSAYGWEAALMSSQLLCLPTWGSHKIKQQIISINQKCIKAVNKSLDRMLGSREEGIYKLSISEIGDIITREFTELKD